MNQETVNKANNLLASEKWCSDVITHIYKKNRMSLRFDVTQSCIESNDSCMVTKEDVLRWLKSEVRVDGDM